ncbi:phage tail protein [Aeromonas veronii]
MSQVITNAFEQYWQSCLAAEKPVVLDEFILADIPNLDITSPIDPETGLPPESQIVHRQNVDQRGRINNNAVAYTIVMDTTVGDFSFNAMYLRNKQNGVIGMIVYKGRETKLKTDQTTGQTGNSLVKSMLMGYDQAAEATLTHVDAGTWQIDYAARLRGMDEDIRQLQADLYGHHTFVGDGFKVVEKDGAYQVSQGVAIVGGLRVELKAPEVIHPGTKPIGVWVDVHRAGSLLSEHQNHFTIITSVADLADHVDSNGYQHYVAKLGTVQEDSTIEDGRGSAGGGSGGAGSIPDTFALWKRSMAEAGYKVVDGDFSIGGVLESETDVLLWENLAAYSHVGPYPHKVDRHTDPNKEGSGFVDRSKNMLRGDLTGDEGAKLINYALHKGATRSVSDRFKDSPTVDDYLLQHESNLSLAVNRAYADGVYELNVVNNKKEYKIESLMEMPDDFKLFGHGNPRVKCEEVANLVRMNSRTEFSGFFLHGLSPAVLSPHNGAKHVKIRDNHFVGQNQIILILKCSHIDVTGNVFDNTGYGVIQQAGFESNNVRVIGNTAIDMTGDFVEANAASVDTNTWIVSDNIFTGSLDHHEISTERRFAGFTQVENVVVSNNIIYRTAGDSAIHLEDSLGQYFIEGNIFVDCYLGNSAIYNLNSEKDMHLTNNVFVLTDDYKGEFAYAIRTDSNNYNHKCVISDNVFLDMTKDGKKLRPAKLMFGGTFDYRNNMCINTFDICSYSNVSGARFSGNRGVGVLQRGIWSDVGASGGAGGGNVYHDNIIKSLVEPEYGIRAVTNSNGTNGPKRHAAYNNHIAGDIRIQNLSSAPGQTAENAAWGNRVTGSIVVSDRLSADAFGNYAVTAIE